MSTQRSSLTSAKRIVVKIGSSLITNHGQGLDLDSISTWVASMSALSQSGVECILVSSGAIAEGMKRLGWQERPHAVNELQAAAAVGQMGLIQAYESCFQKYDIHTAQVLLTHDDLSDRKRYLNARSSLRALLRLGVVPIVNENDTVVTDEICFGDNDTLAALVANLVEADALVILTDQDGVYDADPRVNPGAKRIDCARASDATLKEMASAKGGRLGKGGMATKIRSAELAARSGTLTVIANGKESKVLDRVFAGDTLGTLLTPDSEPLAARKQWLAGHLQIRGKVTVDAGAERVLRSSGSSLLPVGVVAVEGEFKRGEMVDCVNQNGERIACGLVNYHADEALKILRCSSDKIEAVLGYVNEAELIHRDNMVVF